MSTKDLPSKEIRRIIKRLAPDLQRMLDILDESNNEDYADSVAEDSIRTGAHNLLIAKRIIKENKK